MKRENIKRHLLVALSIILLMGHTACGGDTGTQDREALLRGELSLGLRTGKPGAVLTYGGTIPGTAEENRLNRLRVLIFDDRNAAPEKNDYYQNGTLKPVPVLPHAFTYSLFTGQKTICVIGNEPADLKGTLDAIDDYNTLQTLRLTGELSINGQPLELPFSIIRRAVLNPTSLTGVELVLQRRASKVQVNMAKDVTNNKKVELKSIRLINVPEKASLAGDDPLPLTVPGDITSLPQETSTYPGIAGSQILTTTHEPLSIARPYAYEYYPETAAAAPMLQVSYEENGIPKMREAPVVCGTNEAGEYIVGLRRNVVCNMTLTVLKDHIKVKYRLDEWDQAPPYDKIPGDPDSSITFDDWTQSAGQNTTLN